MKRRRWDSRTKTKIVIEGLSGRPVSEICNEYGIQYIELADFGTRIRFKLENNCFHS